MRDIINELNESYIPPSYTKAVLTNLSKRRYKQHWLSDQSSVTLDIDDLYQMWLDAGKPDDTDDLYMMLKPLGVTKSDFSAALEQSNAQGTNWLKKERLDPRITRLANAISGVHLDGYVIDYLKQLLGIKESRNITESVMTDAAIKHLFTSLVDRISKSEDGILNTMRKWQAQFHESTATDQYQLCRDALELIDQHNDQRTLNIVMPIVISGLKDSDIVMPVKQEIIRMMRENEIDIAQLDDMYSEETDKFKRQEQDVQSAIDKDEDRVIGAQPKKSANESISNADLHSVFESVIMLDMLGRIKK